MGFFGGGGGGSSAPGGVAGDTQVIFNDAGTLAGDGSLLYDKVGDRLLVGGPGPFTAGAILEVKSITGTLLLPRVTTTQRNAIGAPNGSILFNTDTGRLSLVAGSAWGELLNTNSGGDVDFTSGSFYFHAPVGGGFRGANWISDATAGGFAYLMGANVSGSSYLRASVIGVTGFPTGLLELMANYLGSTQALRVYLQADASSGMMGIYSTTGYFRGLVVGSANYPDTTTVLQLDSTYGALLLPRLTAAQSAAVAAVNGKLIFDTDKQMLGLITNSTYKYFGRDVSVKGTNSAASYNIPNAVLSVLNFDFTWYDTDTMHQNGAMPRFTCKVAGKYLMEIYITFSTDGAGVGYRQATIRVNGTINIFSIYDVKPSTTMASYMRGTVTFPLNVGDYVEVLVYQNSGNPLAIIGSNGSANYDHYFGMVKAG